ncbi:MAG: substrate-binding domain-containing protein [Phycisphaerales bacterium]|nr:substrate-binding domain-containing protein [Phycisphaerales bacterium]
MVNNTFQLQEKLPPRGVTQGLCRQLRQYLLSNRPAVGEQLMTDAELSKSLNLSRSSIRRAMIVLQKEGWINRQVGRGTFVGPRLMLEGGVLSEDDNQPNFQVDEKIIRMAVVVFWDPHNTQFHVNNWYTPEILRGIGDHTSENHITVELISTSRPEPDTVLTKIRRQRPDVIVFTAGDVSEVLSMRDAQRLNIPIICTGTKFAVLDFTVLLEDNDSAIELAVNHLLEHGHRKLMLALPTDAVAFTFERMRAFHQIAQKHGVKPGDWNVVWVDVQTADQASLESEVSRYCAQINHLQPTGLICGSAKIVRATGMAMRRMNWHIPQDISMVAIDQSPEASTWFAGLNPSTIEIPLYNMGRRIAELAPLLARGEKVPSLTRLLCQLKPGDSVAAPSTNRVLVGPGNHMSCCLKLFEGG